MEGGGDWLLIEEHAHKVAQPTLSEKSPAYLLAITVQRHCQATPFPHPSHTQGWYYFLRVYMLPQDLLLRIYEKEASKFLCRLLNASLSTGWIAINDCPRDGVCIQRADPESFPFVCLGTPTFS